MFTSFVDPQVMKKKLPKVSNFFLNNSKFYDNANLNLDKAVFSSLETCACDILQ